MPVRSVNGFTLAAIADVGAVFSEMKLIVVPANCFHSSVETGSAPVWSRRTPRAARRRGRALPTGPRACSRARHDPPPRAVRAAESST